MVIIAVKNSYLCQTCSIYVETYDIRMSLGELEPLLDQVCIYHRLQGRRRKPLKHRREDSLRVLVFMHGQADVYIAQRHYHAQRGACFIIGPEIACTCSARSEHEKHQRLELDIPIGFIQSCTQLHDDMDMLCQIVDEFRVPLNNRQTNELLERCERLEHQRLDAVTESHSALARFHHLSGILLLIHAAWSEQTSPKVDAVHPLVKRALDYIDRELMNPNLRLNDCAESIACTPTYLSRIFRAELGSGFKEYVLKKRMALAKHALRNGATVTDACYDSGFNDYANFVKRFAQRCGMSPGRFRAAHIPLR